MTNQNHLITIKEMATYKRRTGRCFGHCNMIIQSYRPPLQVYGNQRNPISPFAQLEIEPFYSKAAIKMFSISLSLLAALRPTNIDALLANRSETHHQTTCSLHQNEFIQCLVQFHYAVYVTPGVRKQAGAAGQLRGGKKPPKQNKEKEKKNPN